MTLREQLSSELSGLSDEELRRVMSFASFLRSKRAGPTGVALDDATLKAQYTEAGEDDRTMAQEGMGDYSAGLRKEDKG
jgi:hypothetical protein